MLITITSKEVNKIIERFDVDLPPDAKWIAQDRNGEWYWYYKTKPIYEITGWGHNFDWRLIKQGKPNPYWKDTLIDVRTIE